MTAAGRRVLAVSGGVGGAKLALGLATELNPADVHVLVNTGDDFNHLGLHISPDIDTLLYTLGGRANRELGWGLQDETWHTMAALEQLGGETWFRLGDRDLATHLWRSARLAAGDRLSAVTAALAVKLGVASQVHPMTDDPVHTIVHSDEGDLPFQSYFVRRRCEPAVRGFSFTGIETAAANPAVLALLGDAGLQAIVLCPSNPFVSIDPVLQLPGLWQAMRAAPVPVIAVSPIVAGLAIKGPAAKMLQELGMPVTALAVARHYQHNYPGLLDCFVIDHSDDTLTGGIRETGVDVITTSTIMHTLADKRALAATVMEIAGG